MTPRVANACLILVVGTILLLLALNAMHVQKSSAANPIPVAVTTSFTSPTTSPSLVQQITSSTESVIIHTIIPTCIAPSSQKAITGNTPDGGSSSTSNARLTTTINQLALIAVSSCTTEVVTPDTISATSASRITPNPQTAAESTESTSVSDINQNAADANAVASDIDVMIATTFSEMRLQYESLHKRGVQSLVHALRNIQDENSVENFHDTAHILSSGLANILDFENQQKGIIASLAKIHGISLNGDVIFADVEQLTHSTSSECIAIEQKIIALKTDPDRQAKEDTLSYCRIGISTALDNIHLLINKSVSSCDYYRNKKLSLDMKPLEPFHCLYGIPKCFNHSDNYLVKKSLGAGPHILDNSDNASSFGDIFLVAGTNTGFYGPNNVTSPFVAIHYYEEGIFGLLDFDDRAEFTGVQYSSSTSTSLETANSVILGADIFMPITSSEVNLPNTYADNPLFFRIGPVVKVSESLRLQNRNATSDNDQFTASYGMRIAGSDVAYLDFTVGKTQSLAGERFYLESYTPLYVVSQQNDIRAILHLSANLKARLWRGSDDQVFQFGVILQFGSNTFSNISSGN